MASWLFVTGLAGCASLQSPTAAVLPPVPTHWSAAGSQASGLPATGASTPWWQQFGDDTLSMLVGRTLANATDLQAAQARLRQARALRDLALAGTAATLDASASAQASDSDGGAPTRQFRTGFDAGWEVDLWGGRRAGVAAAAADVQASAATLGQTQVALAAEVAAAYIELRSGQGRLDSARAGLAAQERTLRIVQWRNEAGLATGLEVEQQRSAVAQTRAQLPALQAGVAQSMNALAVLAGEPPGALHARLETPAPLPAAPAELALAIPAAVLAQRADVQAAEARVHAAAARVQQKDAERLPSLRLSGSIGLNALSLTGLGTGAGVATLLAGVAVPVFDGGRLTAQVRALEAALDEARVNHRAVVLAALREVEDALLALRSAREQHESLQLAAAAARRAMQLAEHRHAGGLIDFQVVLQTERTRLAADDALAVAAATLLTQHARLYKALGGGWVADAGVDAAVADRRETR
jgi:NodT family efflux transporter outer membrane factor (OMF) lipoprotein